MRNARAMAGLLALACLVLVALLAPMACPGGAMARLGPAFAPPGPAFWLGSDNLGRSVACLTAYGLRTSLAVAGSVMVLAALCGIVVGLAAGYAGGVVDRLLMQLTAAFQVVPRFFLAIMVAALFGPSLPGLVLVLGATSWPLIARLVRAEALSLRERPFVMAAHALGCSASAILWRHILPNAMPPVWAGVAVLTAGAVSAEAALGFVGLGDGRSISLGRLVADAYPYFSHAPWVSGVPVAALVATVLGIHGAVRQTIVVVDPRRGSRATSLPT